MLSSVTESGQHHVGRVTKLNNHISGAQHG